MTNSTSTLSIATMHAMQYRWDSVLEIIESTPSVIYDRGLGGKNLFLVCAGFGGSSPVLQRLAALGVDPNCRAGDQSNALAAVIVGGSRFGSTTLPELRILLELGADPNQVADCGMPAIH
jgi:hypothetical protein